MIYTFFVRLSRPSPLFANPYFASFPSGGSG